MTTIEDIKQRVAEISNEASCNRENNGMWLKLTMKFEEVHDKDHWKKAIPAKEYSAEDAVMAYAAIDWFHRSATIEALGEKIIVGSKGYCKHSEREHK